MASNRHNHGGRLMDARMRFIGFLIVASLCVPDGIDAAQPESKSAAFFEAKIRPLLVRRCLRCHGGEKVNHGLRVDSREAIVRGGESGPAGVPGNPDESLLIRAVRYADDAIQMPPEGKLPQEEIALLERWVKLRLPWPESPKTHDADEGTHWAFQPVRPIQPPEDPTGRARNPIDAFVVARLRKQGLSPVEAADPRTLIRRVSFDLIGLPPVWEDVAAFMDDHSDAAYRRLIDRLLDSPQYGERWGRHWLDLARYSDTQGGSVDCPIPEARLYRDYVIDSFNADKPYDEFLREQISGDLMAADRSPSSVGGASDRYRQRIIATGFLGLSIRNGIFKHYHPELIIEDTIDTIGRSILGMTIRCARCHDHKFEPISTADYYRLYGIFASSRYPFSGSELPQYSAGESVPLISPAQWADLPDEQREAIERLREKIADERAKHPAQKSLKEKRDRLARDVRRYHEIRSQGQFDVALRTSIDDQDIRIREDLSTLDVSVRALWGELKAAEQAAGIERAYAMREQSPHDAQIQVAGDPFDAGPVVARGVPERLAGDNQLQIPDGQSGRLQLARWLTSPDNPLTPRVAVNYVWQFHFGKGIVSTPDNFGLGGAAPTHPDLLDWLAREFMDSGWSVKHLHRLILTSNTYRLASRADESALAIDPANRWHWRFDPRRLDAESIRDGMMHVAGTLNSDRPGPHPFPPEAKWNFSQHAPFKAAYESPHRSVYLMTQRLQRHPFLTLFDGPDTSRPTPIRKSTTRTLQALYLRNSPFIHRQAESLAARLIESIDDPRHRIESAVRRAWSREPSSDEVDGVLAYVDRYARQWKQDSSRRSGDEPELLLEYRFEGNANDTSGLGRHGTLVGNPQFVDGPSGQCISLDGDGDYVDSGVTINPGDSFTVECLVRPRPEQAHYAEIFGNHLGGGSRGFVLQQNGGATNRFRGSYGAGGGEVWIITDPVTLPAGQWHRIALVRTPTALRLFLGGRLSAEIESTAAGRPSELTFRVGLGISIVERSFFGEIDDVRVYRGVPERFRTRVLPEQVELAAWSSYCRLLLTANEFLYVD